MITFLTAVTATIAVFLLVGLLRVIKGPSAADRMLSAQLFGTSGVAILMLLAIVQREMALLNAALVLAMLAPITLITFVRLVGGRT